jgi:hypothetical protein
MLKCAIILSDECVIFAKVFKFCSKVCVSKMPVYCLWNHSCGNMKTSLCKLAWYTADHISRSGKDLSTISPTISHNFPKNISSSANYQIGKLKLRIIRSNYASLPFWIMWSLLYKVISKYRKNTPLVNWDGIHYLLIKTNSNSMICWQQINK